ncbi:MAG: helix-turn-helix transcriptional regulator [Acidobacteria bacterium]|nr:helix-turn-helix transcriptional regulator [Acidobacteriota bacterium]MBS1865759.1 helix-turn-helix transcriptional regulator [Acidobacteriota bacterium]
MDRRITRLKGYLTERFCEPLSLAEMAAQVNLSPSRLSHLFKREIGVPPQEFLKQVRMGHAKKLLEDSFLLVKEIMARCGFNDESHFVRDFEKLHGKTPRRYREDLLGSQDGFSKLGQRIAEEANKP